MYHTSKWHHDDHQATINNQPPSQPGFASSSAPQSYPLLSCFGLSSLALSTASVRHPAAAPEKSEKQKHIPNTNISRTTTTTTAPTTITTADNNPGLAFSPAPLSTSLLFCFGRCWVRVFGALSCCLAACFRQSP